MGRDAGVAARGAAGAGRVVTTADGRAGIAKDGRAGVTAGGRVESGGGAPGDGSIRAPQNMQLNAPPRVGVPLVRPHFGQATTPLLHSFIAPFLLH